MEILIDFDGTCVTHDFPKIGKSIGAESVLRKIVDNGHKLILFTMRSDIKNPVSSNSAIITISGNFLTQAVDWFTENDIPLYGIQTNPTQKNWTTSPKAYGQLMIDDSALGCPLTWNKEVSERPFVDWVVVEEMLYNMGILQ